MLRKTNHNKNNDFVRHSKKKKPKQKQNENRNKRMKAIFVLVLCCFWRYSHLVVDNKPTSTINI